MSAHTHIVIVTRSDVTKTYTSWTRGEHRREWSVLRHVHAHAPDLVPRPLAARLDAVPPVVTMTRVPGRPLGGTLSKAQLDALATAVQTLWTVPPHDRQPVDDLGFARRLVTGPRPSSGAAAAAFDAAVDWWDGPDPALLRTTPPATGRSEASSGAAATVLGHRDGNLANYLWDGRRVRIVDLEDAAVSSPEMELAILVEHLSARRMDGDGFCARFDVDPERLLAARRLWAMFWLRLLLPGGPAERRNPPGTTEAQARRLLTLLEPG